MNDDVSWTQIVVGLLIVVLSLWLAAQSELAIARIERDFERTAAQERAAELTHLQHLHPDWPWGLITAGKIQLGMTDEMVLASWGVPDDINRSVYSWGIHEQWVYRRDDFHAYYLYFEDGVLTSWQET